jgi:hypothetical protein
MWHKNMTKSKKTKTKKAPKVVVETDLDEDVIELDEDVLQQFGTEIQTAIEIVVHDNMDRDVRIELVNILMSIAAQVSVDVGINENEFMGMADFFYGEGQKIVEETDISEMN